MIVLMCRCYLSLVRCYQICISDNIGYQKAKWSRALTSGGASTARMQQLNPGVQVDLDAKLTELKRVQHDLQVMAGDSDYDSDWLCERANKIEAEIAAARNTPATKVSHLVHTFLDQWEIAKPAADAPRRLVQEVEAITSVLPRYIQLGQQYAELKPHQKQVPWAVLQSCTLGYRTASRDLTTVFRFCSKSPRELVLGLAVARPDCNACDPMSFC